MIPVIGLMVGLYIITRMADLVIDKHNETSVVTAALAIFTIIAAGYAIYYCLSKGGEVVRLLQ